jgi:hypothetical protein
VPKGKQRLERGKGSVLASRAETSLPQFGSIRLDIGKRRPTERIANKLEKPAGVGGISAGYGG